MHVSETTLSSINPEEYEEESRAQGIHSDVESNADPSRSNSFQNLADLSASSGDDEELLTGTGEGISNTVIEGSSDKEVMTLPSTAVIHTPSSRRPSSELRVTTGGDIPVHEQGAAAFVPVDTTAPSAAITDAHIAENAPREPTPSTSTVQLDNQPITTQRVFTLFITPPAGSVQTKCCFTQ
ncbi:hypothetical protein [Kistimonas asteriae]|uniref:hypothetical protein n=1 Tax=Kistimonas asteriae TaxID=517724 RepID=UPI001BA70B64|nr:hypothetical protein [Kistimonas asteriae]